ncbi:MAG: NAD(P)H-binding protein [Deltaproteobacteria bacterium]|nr:NAD(P)H-binding protein [Deltaproteobacteria bacterium]MBV8454229.1 NAD(P)H-binding protein [Deltaproteobacteria bacterium]
MANRSPVNVVTGAFGYTGRYITALLLQRGVKVRTLTGHPNRANPFGDAVEAVPFSFDNPDALARSLDGAEVVFNTYWIRFPRGELTFDRAARNVKALIDAARQAGVNRFIHISITNASADSQLPYFRGKGVIEHYLMNSGLSYAILRPAIIFGSQDILLHNISWMLRRFPLFTIPGNGNYRLQPVFVGDLAELAANMANEQRNLAIDAVGPETFTFNELVALLARTVASKAWIVHVSPSVELILARIFSRLTGDVTLTRDEINGLMQDLLVSTNAPTAATRLSEWLARNADTIGTHYRSEVLLRA